MRKELGKLLDATIREAMRREMPYFEPWKDATGGRTMYQFQPAPGLRLFIYFQKDPKRDEFTVEIGWSEHDRWPADYMPGMPRDISELRVSRSPPENGEFRARLSKFWELPHKDSWWEIVPNHARWESQRALRQIQPDSTGDNPEPPREITLDQARARISPLVDDAIAKLKQFAVPFFEEVTLQHGAVWRT